MTWMTDFTSEDAQAKAAKALSLPIGAASPLWLAYAGATAGAMTYWWMSRWVKPVNLEAMSWPALPQFTEVFEKMSFANPFASLVPGAEDPAAASPAALEPVALDADPLPALAAVEPVIEAAEVVVETIAKVMAAPDDLTVLVGIGPTLASKLGDLGVKTYADIAAWSDDDVETFDKQLKLLGRIRRDGWIGQAKQLAEAGL